MPISDNIASFSDVERAFRLALAHPDGVIQPIRADTPEAAKRASIRWRQRAYRFRELLRKQIASAYGADPAKSHLAGTTPFDDFVLKLVPAGVKIERQGADLGEPFGLGLAHGEASQPREAVRAATEPAVFVPSLDSATLAEIMSELGDLKLD